ncbi:MAG: small multi-drug export protein [Candidatus Eisenbacteria bacterium]
MSDPSWFASLPKELVIFVMAMLPILELRGAIPWAFKFASDLPLATIYLTAVLGNFVPVIPILLLLEPVSRFLRKAPIFDRFFTWLFARTRRRGKLVEKYEAIGLTLFVAIPLPVTGAWTGAVAAFVFGVRTRWAAVCIALGVLIAGGVVTLASKGVISIWHLAT